MVKLLYRESIQLICISSIRSSKTKQIYCLYQYYTYELYGYFLESNVATPGIVPIILIGNIHINNTVLLTAG